MIQACAYSSRVGGRENFFHCQKCGMFISSYSKIFPSLMQSSEGPEIWWRIATMHFIVCMMFKWSWDKRKILKLFFGFGLSHCLVLLFKQFNILFLCNGKQSDFFWRWYIGFLLVGMDLSFLSFMLIQCENKFIWFGSSFLYSC